MKIARQMLFPAMVLWMATATAHAQSYEVIRAQYGALNSWVDVTQQVRSMVRGEYLSFRVANDVLGGDPRPSEVKTLRIDVRGDSGRRETLTFREGERVQIRLSGTAGNTGGGTWTGGGGRGRGEWGGGGNQAGGNLGGGTELRILRATYGYRNRFVEVTGRLNRVISGGELRLKVNNDSMGGDPAYGEEKELIVDYQYMGRRREIRVREDEWLHLPGDGGNAIGGGFGGGNWTGGGNALRIVRARYGYGNRYIDVTSRLGGMIRDDRLSIRISNDAMGGDPASGMEKDLVIVYEYRGRRQEVRVKEDDRLTIP